MAGTDKTPDGVKRDEPPPPTPLRPAARRVPAPRRTVPAAPPGQQLARFEGPATDFLPDALAIEARPLPRLARTVVPLIGLMLLVAVLWAALATMDRIVTAPGRIITSEPLIVAQPLETATIRTLNVRPGDMVRRGQVLATLDPTFVEADLADLRFRFATLNSRVRRLEADTEGRPFVARPGDELDRAEMVVWQQRGSEYQARLRAYEQTDTRLRAEREGLDRMEAGLSERLEIYAEVERMRQTLVAREVGSRLQLLDARAQRLNMRDQLNRIADERRETDAKIAQNEAERSAFVSSWQRELSENLVDTRRDLATVTEQLRKAERRSSLVTLIAPADAVVLEVAQRSVGSVARDTEPLVTLVPTTAPLEAEVMIDPRDIAYVRSGDAARVKLLALPFQRHGTLDGRLKVVSPDTVTTQPGRDAVPAQERQPVYRGYITLGPVHLRAVPEDFRLLPGMTVAAEIQVGRRSVLTYLLWPLVKVWDESMREP